MYFFPKLPGTWRAKMAKTHRKLKVYRDMVETRTVNLREPQVCFICTQPHRHVTNEHTTSGSSWFWMTSLKKAFVNVAPCLWRCMENYRSSLCILHNSDDVFFCLLLVSVGLHVFSKSLNCCCLPGMSAFGPVTFSHALCRLLICVYKILIQLSNSTLTLLSLGGNLFCSKG